MFQVLFKNRLWAFHINFRFNYFNPHFTRVYRMLRQPKFVLYSGIRKGFAVSFQSHELFSFWWNRNPINLVIDYCDTCTWLDPPYNYIYIYICNLKYLLLLFEQRLRVGILGLWAYHSYYPFLQPVKNLNIMWICSFPHLCKIGNRKMTELINVIRISIMRIHILTKANSFRLKNHTSRVCYQMIINASRPRFHLQP